MLFLNLCPAFSQIGGERISFFFLYLLLNCLQLKTILRLKWYIWGWLFCRPTDPKMHQLSEGVSVLLESAAGEVTR